MSPVLYRRVHLLSSEYNTTLNATLRQHAAGHQMGLVTRTLLSRQANKSVSQLALAGRQLRRFTYLEEFSSILSQIQGMVVRALRPDDGPLLQQLCEACTDFYELAYQRPPGAAEAQGIYTSLPDGASYKDKVLIGMFDKGDLVAFVDLIRGTETARIWQIGLVLVRPDYRGRGLGTVLFQEVRKMAGAGGATAIDLAVDLANSSAHRFWLKRGFVPLDPSDRALIRLRLSLLR